jgi:O-antigen biosynthesis protein WbqP
MYQSIKRFIDFFIALIGIVLLLPLYLLIVVAIKIDSRGPILFKQKRVGKNKKHFYIYKFRSMRSDTPKDVPTHLLENPDQWITKVGKILRRTSLDELPQVFNVLKGDMAIVGPRPALYNQEDLIALRDELGANNLRPGITGLAQIYGRDELPIAQKAFLDGEYVKLEGPWRDLKIILRTLTIAFTGKGVVEGRNDTESK